MRRMALVLLLLTGCASNPFSGRSQFLLTSDSEEQQLGVQAYQEILSKENISVNPAEVDPVKRVGRRIQEVVNKPDYKWEFNVIVDDDTVNAWALPGGKIAFYTGIFPILEDEAGMAFVMGHEISHALLRHGGERMSQNRAVGAAGSLLGVVLGRQDKRTQKAVLSAFGVGVNVGILLPFSRSHESEADEVGLELMAKAGYDPRVAVEVWKRMAALGGRKQAEFLSTHPSHDTRIRDLEARMPEALALYEKSKRAPVTRLPKVGGRKGKSKGGKAAASLTAVPGSVSVESKGYRRSELEGGLKAVAFDVAFSRDVYVDKIRVQGPDGVDQALDAGNGVVGASTRKLYLHRTKTGGPDFASGRYGLTFAGSVSGRSFTVSCDCDVH